MLEPSGLNGIPLLGCFARSALLVFQSLLLVVGLVVHSFLQEPLVWPETGVRWSHFAVDVFGRLIQSNGERRQIVARGLDCRRVLSPDLEWTIAFACVRRQRRTPHPAERGPGYLPVRSLEVTVHLGRSHPDDRTSVLERTGHLMRSAGEEAPLAEANLACQIGRQVLNLHQSVVIDLELADDEIVDRRRHLKSTPPGQPLAEVHLVEFVCLAVVCLEENDSNRTQLDAGAPELALEVRVCSNLPSASLTVDGEDGGVMHDLLSEETVPLQENIAHVALSAFREAPFRDSQARRSRRGGD